MLHATFSVVVQVSGSRGSSGATPACGPRNCGQFCAWAVRAGTAVRTRMAEIGKTNAACVMAAQTPGVVAPDSSRNCDGMAFA